MKGGNIMNEELKQNEQNADGNVDDTQNANEQNAGGNNEVINSLVNSGLSKDDVKDALKNALAELNKDDAQAVNIEEENKLYFADFLK